jgi:hypothetical protein
VYVSSERALHVAYGGHEELVMDTTRFVKEARRSSIFCTEVVTDFEGFAFGPTNSVIEGPANVAPNHMVHGGGQHREEGDNDNGCSSQELNLLAGAISERPLISASPC